jgi:hypothetical protein
MPVYDRRCTHCERIDKDCFEPISAHDYRCEAAIEDLTTAGVRECKGVMERTWLPGAANGVQDDSIPGGLYIKNALCNPDGTPKRYDSKSDIRRAEIERGYTNHVEHIGSKGSDKNPHTTRWVGLPQGLDPKAEAERVAHWHAHESSLAEKSS